MLGVASGLGACGVMVVFAVVLCFEWGWYNIDFCGFG